jgi:hypothetical protein
VSRVLAEHHDLAAVKQVRQLRRLHILQHDLLAHRQLQVHQHRMIDLGVQAADLGFNVLGGTDVGAGRARLQRDLIEQGGVDLMADTEREYARARRVLGQYILHDLGGIGHADSRQAVGEKDHGEGPAGVGLTQVEGSEQGVVDVGAADRFDAVDPVLRAADVVRRSFPQAGTILVRGVREGDQAEAVLRPEPVEQESQGLLGLDNGVAGHASRDIEHEHQVARLNVVLGQLGARRQQQHEMSLGRPGRPMRQQRHAHVLLAQRVQELKILVEQGLLFLEMIRASRSPAR